MKNRASKTKTYANGVVAPDLPLTLRGGVSGTALTIPDTTSGYPEASLSLRGSGQTQRFSRGFGYPDTENHRFKLGVLVPATNCTVEAEMWRILGCNPQVSGVGLHTGLISTPDARFGDAGELERYRRQFDANIMRAVDEVIQCEPHYLILGFSMEHFSSDPMENLRHPDAIEARTGLGVATWSRASAAALQSFGASRISLLCPFDSSGVDNAAGLFENLGFSVVRAAGLNCATGIDVGHIPNEYKAEIIREHLAIDAVEAVVVCGSNLSSLTVAEALEPRLKIPIIGINAALLWYALRELGIETLLEKASALLKQSSLPSVWSPPSIES